MSSLIRLIGRAFSLNWYEKLSRLFVGFMIINTISMFEGFWWEETFAIANGTLLLAIIIDFLLGARSRILRVIIQVILCIAVTVAYAEVSKVYGETANWREWLVLMWGYAVQLNPFIWISGSLLVIYLLFSSWVNSRPRVFAFIGVNLFSLTIADSFTPIWLWDEVAWVVLLGLLWLVATHLHRLEREHPRSWKELLEYPLQLLLPVTFVLTLLMTIGLLMPSISPILQDPYTIWKEAKGETVNVFLGDKGNSSPSQTSNGNASSGYGRDDTQLGGGFDYDYSPVMMISTSHRSYWRGETKSIYSGNGWDFDETIDDGAPVTGLIKDGALPLKDDRSSAETTKVDQIVTMIRKDRYPVLFAASPITTVNWVNKEGQALQRGLEWSASAMELRWMDGSRRKFPEAYAVSSEVTVLDEEALRNTSAGWEEASRSKPYLQLPSELPTRVKQLAEQITADASNDYDRAKMIEGYLRMNFVYTNKPDLTKLSGSSNDFTDQFLFELQEGYCDYFSTTMAVLSRSIGLPARWVKGFAPGTLPAAEYGGPMMGMPDEIDLNPNGEGTYTVRNSDAHSWVEIYFDGYGWIPFEATAGFAFPYTLPQEVMAETPDVNLEADEEAVATESTTNASITIGLWSVVSLLVALLAVWIFVKRKTLTAAWTKFKFRSYSADERIVWETEKLLKKCRKKGLERAEHETLNEAVSRWSLSRSGMKGEFLEILNGFERAKYSSATATIDDAERFMVRVRAIIKQL
ncbi:MAG: DUF4129 domain-containing transglutaminase family protein [Candidatus Pristimantibacillus sp.]